MKKCLKTTVLEGKGDTKQAVPQMPPAGGGPGPSSVCGAGSSPGLPRALPRAEGLGPALRTGPSVRSSGRNPDTREVQTAPSRGQKMLSDEGRYETPNKSRQSMQE